MLKTEIQLDNEKIKREGKYDLDKIYETINGAFKRYGLVKLPSSEDMIIYRDNGNENDFAHLWLINLSLQKQEWFMRNVVSWMWYNSDEGVNENDFAIEDILDYCKKKQKNTNWKDRRITL